MNFRRFIYLLGLFALLVMGFEPNTPSDDAGRWWKGNLHTHSLWSDGDDFPEMIVDWYKQQGYNFLALSDHNILADGEKWIDVAGRDSVLAAYVKRFGDDWVEQRRTDSLHQVRLKTLAEYRPRFEEPDTFLLIQSEEITDRFGQKPIHVNATNILDLIAPQGGGSVREVMQNNVDAVLEQRERTGQPMFPHINHPNFGWAITAEDLVALQGEQFFEVYNGHPAVHNEGDSLRPGTERMWDIILAERLTQGRDVLYGIAVDDAHNYHEMTSERSNPGRAWVMVRALELTPDALIAAMEAGEFYGSTGVVLEDVVYDDDALRLTIQPEDGVTYVTRFIGTRKGYEPSTSPVDTSGVENARVTRQYSEDIGIVLAEVEGTAPRYDFTGDELYVRAKVTSSKPKINPYRKGEHEMAWTQPVLVRRRE